MATSHDVYVLPPLTEVVRLQIPVAKNCRWAECCCFQDLHKHLVGNCENRMLDYLGHWPDPAKFYLCS